MWASPWARNCGLLEYRADGMEVFGIEMTTYQAIIGIGFNNILDLIAILIMVTALNDRDRMACKPDTLTSEALTNELKSTVKNEKPRCGRNSSAA